MNTNYLMKRKNFIYFIKCYWIKNLLSIVIQNKKIFVFHEHKINSLHVYYLISCYIWFVYLFFLCKIEHFGTLINISFNMFLKFFFQKFAFFKSFKNLVMCFVCFVFCILLKRLLKVHCNSFSVDRVLQLHIFFKD